MMPIDRIGQRLRNRYAEDMSEVPPDITSLTRFIRDYGHDPRHLQRLISDLVNWNQIWSAIDVIDDCEFAFYAYNKASVSTGSGEAYLLAYGVLQALFVQQDALMNLRDAIAPSIEIELTPRLVKIREIRNMSIGHPTKFSRKKEISSYFINRSSLIKEGFELFSFSLHTKTQINRIDIPELIADQEKEIAALLQTIVDQLKQKDEEHKAEFRESKLNGSFSQVLYAIEKINERFWGGQPAILATWGVGALKTALEEFEEHLKKRGLDLNTYDPIKYHYENIAHPLAQLTAFLNGEKSEIMSEATAEVFVGYLAGEFGHLIQIADEIDEEYEGK
jgi:hypothetical protein